tara:strand:+ start:2643 stop:2945 length:303 start_codon:yes stop_codon:yes gene_type:complete
MSGEDYLDIPKTDETQQPTPEEQYFSRSKNTWLYVSDMSDMHVRRAFKRLLRMIRLGQLIDLSEYEKPDAKLTDVRNQADAIIKHSQSIIKKLDEIDENN